MDHLIRSSSENPTSRNIAAQIGCFNVLEQMYGVFSLDRLGNLSIGKKLLMQIKKTRKFRTSDPALKEIVRLLHCAALNCCIAMVSTKEEEKHYQLIFDDAPLIWENVVDCEASYIFEQTSSALRINRRKLVNIRKSHREKACSSHPLASFTYQCDLTASSLMENFHAYDLNNVVLKPQDKVEDDRITLNYEHDQLNDHECMMSVVGVLKHLFTSDISKLPRDEEPIDQSKIPKYMLFFNNAFVTKKDNVILFLLKVVCNTKDVFVPYVKLFFQALCSCIINFLKNNELNYVIRDVLVVIIESKHILQDLNDKNCGQKLVEKLVVKAESTTSGIYR